MRGQLEGKWTCMASPCQWKRMILFIWKEIELGFSNTNKAPVSSVKLRGKESEQEVIHFIYEALYILTIYSSCLDEAMRGDEGDGQCDTATTTMLPRGH